MRRQNFWTIPEQALMLFLRSRRIRDRFTILVLNERYAPTVRAKGSIRNKLKAIRTAEERSGRIDLTYDRYLSAAENVDRWVRLEMDDADELSRLLTFTQHELDIMETSLTQLNAARGASLFATGPSQVLHNQGRLRPENIQLAAGPSQVPLNQGGPALDRIQPWVGPSQVPAGQEPRRGGYYGSAPNPSLVLDPWTRPVMGAQGQMPFPTAYPEVRPNQPAWPVWDADLERLFPNMGPPRFNDGFPFGDPQAAVDAAVNAAYADPYQQSREFEEWESQEREEEGDDEDEDDEEEENEEEEAEEDDDDDDPLNEYREQRDENDNCWYDEDQEELDG